jgi:predicted SAM-dependent methyltransferase
MLSTLKNLKFKLFFLKKKIIYRYRKHYLEFLVFQNKNIKIILGAALTTQKGWVSTNEDWLDITNAEDWSSIFKSKRIIAGVVAEHVFEHLTEFEAVSALKHISKYLMPGKKIRIAVPDGNNPNSEYIKNVGIGGDGPDASDHKQLYTAEKLIDLLSGCGFRAELIEGYTKDFHLVRRDYSIEHGFIRRSRANKEMNNEKYGWDFVDAGTSLIVDGVLEA